MADRFAACKHSHIGVTERHDGVVWAVVVMVVVVERDDDNKLAR